MPANLSFFCASPPWRLCVDILIRMGLRFLQPWLTLLVWLLVLSTLVSMGQRLMLKTPVPIACAVA